MTDSSGTTANYYNEFGEIVRVEKTFAGLATLSTSYSYDGNGNITEIGYPDGRKVHYDYDSQLDQVVKVWTEKSGTTNTLADNITRQPFGGLSGFTFGNGLKTERSYDQQYRLTYLKSGPMLRRAYDGYDGNGNITSITDLVNSGKSQTFTYDALDRLKTAAGAYGSIIYTYDSAGNRLTQASGGQTATYTYPVGSNRLSSISGAQSG